MCVRRASMSSLWYLLLRIADQKRAILQCVPTPSTARLPLPKDEDEFDNIVRDALSLRLSDPSFKRYGRSGQNQHGIDGLAEESGPNAGIAWQATLQQADLLGKLKRDLSKLDESALAVRHLLLCVGAPRDTKLRDDVADLSRIRGLDKKCSLEVLFWDDLCLDLSGDRAAIERHFPTFVNAVAIHESGFMLGPDIIFEADMISMSSGLWTIRFRNSVRGGMSDIARYIADYDSLPIDERFIVSEAVGQGRLLASAPSLERQTLSLHLNAASRRTRVDSYEVDLRLDSTRHLSISSNGFELVSGIEAAIQAISTALSLVYGESVYAPRVGSRCSEFFHSESDMSRVSRLFGLELARFAYAPQATTPPLDFIRSVASLRIQDQKPDTHGRISMEAELLLEGHGRWCGDVGVFVGSIAPQIDRASILREAKALGFYSDDTEQQRHTYHGEDARKNEVSLVNFGGKSKA
jgi:hypothetical protein